MAARTILDEINDLKRAVADLQRATRNPQFSGADDLEEGYGGAIILNNLETDIDPVTSEDVALLIAQGGWELPALSTHVYKSTDSFMVTSGTFATIYGQSFHQAVADGYEIVVPWVTDGATTGELRILNSVIGGNTTDVVTLAAGSGGFATFQWLHGQPIGTRPFAPSVQARRTGGAGNVQIFDPVKAHQVGGRWIDATTDGVP